MVSLVLRVLAPERMGLTENRPGAPNEQTASGMDTRLELKYIGVYEN